MTLTWKPDTYRRNILADFEPYSDWLLGLGRPFDFETVEVQEDRKDFTYAAAVQFVTGQDEPPGTQFRLPADGANVFAAVRLLDSIDGFNGEFGSELAALGDALSIDVIAGNPPPPPEIIAFRTPLRASTKPRKPQDPGTLEWAHPPDVEPDKVVVVGVIDDAINPAHKRFQSPDGRSRVDFAWIQDGVARNDPNSDIDACVGFGRELQRDEIEAVIATAPDEDAALSRLGLVDFTRPGHNTLARRASHGTHVMDIAAGADPETASPKQRIVAVQLPTLATLETSGALLGFFVLCGLHHILSRARVISGALGQAVPVVINFSYGISGGPHNGTHIMERAITAAVSDHKARLKEMFPCAEPVAVVVVPAGNGHLARLHAETPPATQQGEDMELSLCLRKQPDDATSTYLEFWVPQGTNSVTLTVTPPGEAPLPPESVVVGRPLVLIAEGSTIGPGEVVMRMTRDTLDSQMKLGSPQQRVGGPKERILLAIAPTRHVSTARRSGVIPQLAPCGTWRISLEAKAAAGGHRIEAWIQRDDSPFGLNGRGRQSYLVDNAYERFDARGDWRQTDPARDAPTSVIRRQGTLSGIATGEDVVVIGGYDASVISGVARRYPLAPYSAAAKGADSGNGNPIGAYADQRDPDAAAPSETSRTLRGILAAGTRSGSRVAINGTSVAAPQAVRMIASALSDPPTRNGFDARAFIANQVRSTLPYVDRRRHGAGLLPAQALLEPPSGRTRR